MEIRQEGMVSRLLMAARTYIDLEQAKNSCSALTLVLYLIYVCNDPLAFLNELRQALEADTIQAAQCEKHINIYLFVVLVQFYMYPVSRKTDFLRIDEFQNSA